MIERHGTAMYWIHEDIVARPVSQRFRIFQLFEDKYVVSCGRVEGREREFIGLGGRGTSLEPDKFYT